jgi:outer membrane protein assembly factor BamB
MQTRIFLCGILLLFVSAVQESIAQVPTTPGLRAQSLRKPMERSNVVPTATVSYEWPSFRGNGSGIASGSLPVTWSADQNIAWKTKLPGPGASSPVVFRDRIYLTCYSGYFVPDEPGGSQENLKRHLIAIQKSDGKILWEKALSAKLPEEERIRDHGFAASTPAVDSDHIYVFFGKSGVVAFDHDGKQQWHADVGQRTHGWGSAASPVLYENHVLINASVESDSLVALHRLTGEERWRAKGIKESWSTPILVKSPADRWELIVPIQGKVLAFDPMNGKQLWSCDTDITWYMVPTAIDFNGIVYCFGGRSGITSLAVRTGGNGDVTRSHRMWTSTSGSNVSSPVYRKGYLFWAHDSRGEAFCANAETGEVVYQQRLNRAGQVYASSLLADDRVYHLTREGKTFVLAAKPEFEELAVNDLRDGSLFNGSPAADKNRLYIRSDKFLYCIGQ